MQVLFSAPRDSRLRPGQYREEAHVVRRVCEASGVAYTLHAATSQALLGALNANPMGSVLHFVGSGIAGGRLMLETNKGKLCDLGPEALRTVRLAQRPRPVVFVSAQGLEHADDAAEGFLDVGVPAVVLLRGLALGFVEVFYTTLLAWPDDSAPVQEVLNQALATSEVDPDIVKLVVPSHANATEVSIDRSALFHPHNMLRRASSAPALPQMVSAPTRFFGRYKAMQDVCDALLNEEKRVALITGMPGSGKSALAMHVVQFALERRLMRAVFYVNCAKLNRRINERAPNYDAARLQWTLDIAKEIAADIAKKADLQVNHPLLAGGQTGNTTASNAASALKPEQALQQVRIALKELFEDTCTPQREIVLVLDDCEAAGVCNTAFVDLVKGLTEYLGITMLCVSRFASPFLGAISSSHIAHVELEGMDPSAALAMLEHEHDIEAPSPQQMRALGRAVEKLHSMQLCTPEMIQAAARESPCSLVNGRLDILCAKREKSTLEDFRKMLGMLLDDEDAAAGVNFWKLCCERKGARMASQSRTTWTRFSEQLRRHFAQTIGGTRPLSDSSAEGIRNLTRISPVLPAAVSASSRRLVSVSRFIKSFWPWYVYTLRSIRLLSDLWARRVGRHYPVLWLTSRTGVENHIRNAPPGTFMLRLSESYPGSLVAGVVVKRSNQGWLHRGLSAQSTHSSWGNAQTSEKEIQHIIIKMNADGTCSCGAEPFPSLHAAILRTAVFKTVYSGHRTSSGHASQVGVMAGASVPSELVSKEAIFGKTRASAT